MKSLENSEPKKKSKYDQQSEREIGLLRLLVTVEEAIEKNISSSSPENASLLKHNLKLMKNLQTRHFNNELIEMISFVGNRESLEPILEILIQTRDPQIENILNVFLESKDRLIRDIAARGLAKLNALESPLSTGDPAQLGFIAISELLAASQKTSATRRVARSAIPLLAKSKSSVARKDLVKVLVQLFDSETQEIFFNLLSDPNEEVGLEVLSQISKLPSQLTRGILRAALESPHEQIALKAERTL
ncbi:MAG: HEAT repeat domain-containing protein, partial [Candidatus Thorarchaeota archaeon]